MIDDWFDAIELPMTLDQFTRLPTNPAYSYEYCDGYACLTPRPQCYKALLDLAKVPAEAELARTESHSLRLVQPGDWTRFPELFALAFDRVQPFCALDDDRRLQAANRCLMKTITGGDGPVVESACVVATEGQDERPVAGLLVTLQSSKPRDHEGRPANDLPHLTWIFVPPDIARLGLGSAMLARAAGALRSLGYTRLASTFLLGNESSTLWHWRNGFTLQKYPVSFRELNF